jgi:acyl-CoA thioester hydrolase
MTPSFALPIRPDAADIDQLGHVNNAVYVRWIQDVATAHWQASAPEPWRSQLVWMVLRHEIDYRRPALLGDDLLGETWVGDASGARFDRFVRIRRSSDVLVEAKTTWVAVDAVSQRPRRVPPELVAHFQAGG